MRYPRHFIDEDGYEWEAGPHVLMGDPEEYPWRFKPTQANAIWAKMSKSERLKWDYATNDQLQWWKPKVAEEL